MNRLNQYYHRPAIPTKDNEGASYLEYGPASPFQAEMWAAGGKVQAEMYGQRLPNIRNLRIDGTYAEQSGEKRTLQYAIENGPVISPGDGVCLYVSGDSEPDYKIVAVYPYRFLTLEVERL